MAVAPARMSAGEALRWYVREQGTAFLRGAAAARAARDGEADRLMRRSARRISGALYVHGPLTDPAWSAPLRAELDWLAAVLGHEPDHAARLTRLLTALHRLSTPEPLSTGRTSQARWAADAGRHPTPGAPRAPRRGIPGVVRAAALLERQAELARGRAHAAAGEARGSARFHAVCDAVALAASDMPVTPAAADPAEEVVAGLAAAALRRVEDAAAALPLDRAGLPYNAEAVQASLGVPELGPDAQDTPWHALRTLLRLCRHALEVPGAGAPTDPGRLAAAAALLRRHDEAAACATAVAAAARTPRIAPGTAYALGVLHADQRHEVEAARFAFSLLWPARGAAVR